jgi:branched-chain amino acid aminotransferase
MQKEINEEGLVYIDGDIVTSGQAKISVFDSAFVHGDSVQEFTRTFNGKLFKLNEHITRLYKSLKNARIDFDLSPEQLKEITLRILDLNKNFIKPNGDGWIVHLISAGILPKWRKEGFEYRKNTVAIFFIPFKFKSFAKFYRTGVHAVISSIRRVHYSSIDPKMKQCSRMDLNVASREVKCMDPEAFAILLDHEGNIAEGDGQNIFIITDGVIKTPTGRNIMKGISRDTVFELAKELEITVEEVDIQPYDAYNADEAFLTATSFCILPLTKLNWINIDNGKPGPITFKLLDAWSKKVGVDIVQQALSHIEDRPMLEVR